MLKIRSDFLRIARSFCYGNTGVFDANIGRNPLMTPARGIYVEPNPVGPGVQIVSTDGSALCVSWDVKGTVDRGRLITGLTREQVNEFSGAVLDDRWVECNGKQEEMVLRISGKKTVKLDGVQCAKIGVVGEDTQGPLYPAWRHFQLDNERLSHLTRGFPGSLSVSHLGILAKLWQDGMQNVRTIQIYSHLNDPTCPIVVKLPWRDFTTITMMPPKDDVTMWPAKLTEHPDFEGVDTRAPALEPEPTQEPDEDDHGL